VHFLFSDTFVLAENSSLSGSLASAGSGTFNVMMVILGVSLGRYGAFIELLFAKRRK
jgi:hypothetical protein